jgi:DNA-binding protein YbaB
MTDVTATAISPDGMVEVTAGALGDLRGLRLDPRHMRTPDAEALAATILATTQAAAHDARATLPADETDPLFGTVLRELDRLIGPR